MCRYKMNNKSNKFVPLNTLIARIDNRHMKQEIYPSSVIAKDVFIK